MGGSTGAYMNPTEGLGAYNRIQDKVRPYQEGTQSADPNNAGLQALIAAMGNPQFSQNLFEAGAYGGTSPDVSQLASQSLSDQVAQASYILRASPDRDRYKIGEGPGSFLHVLDLLLRGGLQGGAQPTAASPFAREGRY
jgi:hypothetical protein